MSILTDPIRIDREYSELCDVVKKNFRDKPLPVLASGLTGGAADALCIALSYDTKENRKSPVLVICPDEKECKRLMQVTEQYSFRCAFYVTRDLTFYNMTASHEFEHERLKVLRGIAEGGYDLVFTTPDAALGFTIPPNVLKANMCNLDFDTRIEPLDLAKKLVSAGYSRVDMVEGAGQFALRGGIVDIFPPYGTYADTDGEIRQGSYPIRIEFFDDEIDRMGIFELESQRMSSNIGSVSFTPAHELLLNTETREKVISVIRECYKKSDDENISAELLREITQLSNDGSESSFTDKYISVIYPEKKCLFDYFDSRSLVIVRSSGAVSDRIKGEKWREEENIKNLLESGRILLKYAEYSHTAAYFELFLENNVTVHVNSLSHGLTDKRLSGMFGFRTRQPVTYIENLNLLIEDLIGYRHGGYKTIIMTDNETEAKNLAAILTDANFKAAVESDEIEKIDDLPEDLIYITWKTTLQGYEMITPRIAVLSTIGEGRVGALQTSKKKRGAHRKDSKTILSYAELEVGDIVVHETYGIGRYLGLEKLKIDGSVRDYISIQYAGNDKLCMPVEKLDLVSKYIGAHADDGLVKLSKMGGEAWKKATNRAKSAVKEMAKDLIKLYAQRMRKEGYSFYPDDDMQRAFEAAFEYEETDCQLDAIAEIKQDMMRPMPMDRLLCGDVGYGKTEVAFRAAYKAVLSGKQVAFLVPTTILALQHYQTALSRMRDFAVNVDMLSRFRTQKQITQSLRRLERGDTDIIIGTHKLLGSEVKFHNLGLLIVDEEQRFGVSQKEKLKQLGGNIDVLTLSATPIPRTLNMAMSGIRDISLLDEAPIDRHPVQTYVLEYDDMIIMEAIRREMRRCGQVFYIHNFVESIDRVAAHISSCIPDARVTVAHGKMDKDTLEDIWSKMLSGEIDVLVCTTIIETGIDIPNANTLIADRADRLGLSQLHQLRGRVGRSSRRAYAYFTFPKNKSISEIAQKRLEAIREYAEFGSGFRIALRDMEIRGAGNILGAEQHGHLEAIGYDLYIKLLNDAVLEEKGELTEKKEDCTIRIECDAYIPDKYVKYAGQRMTLYKRIALIRNQYDSDDIADELLDRFGDMPRSVENLLSIALIRSYASSLGIKQITQVGNEIRFYQEKIDIDMWSEMSADSGGRIKFMMGANGDNFCVLRLKAEENILPFISKIFEKQIEKSNNNR